MNGWMHNLQLLLSDYNHGISVHPRPLVAASPTVPASGWRGPMLSVAGHYGSCLAVEVQTEPSKIKKVDPTSKRFDSHN